MKLTIRRELPEDIAAIRQITKSAFAVAAHSSYTEHLIVDALRQAEQLTVSLVVLVEEQILGHIAFSPVSISDGSTNWYGLGPVSVAPAFQRQGIGSLLIEEGLVSLQAINAQGCVVLGNPAFYVRFGFAVHAGLEYPRAPAQFFMGKSFSEKVPCGQVSYHPSFEIQAESL